MTDKTSSWSEVLGKLGQPLIASEDQLLLSSHLQNQRQEVWRVNMCVKTGSYKGWVCTLLGDLPRGPRTFAPTDICTQNQGNS